VGSFVVTSSGSVVIEANDQIPDALPIALQGGLDCSASDTIGPLTITDGNINGPLTGVLTLAGDVNVTSNQFFSSIGGHLGLSGTRTITVAEGVTIPITGTVSGGVASGTALIKAGAGVLSIGNKPCTYTGATVVDAGTLAVFTSLTSPVTVNAG